MTQSHQVMIVIVARLLSFNNKITKAVSFKANRTRLEVKHPNYPTLIFDFFPVDFNA